MLEQRIISTYSIAPTCPYVLRMEGGLRKKLQKTGKKVHGWLFLEVPSPSLLETTA